MRSFLLATTAVVALGSAAWAASDNAANNTSGLALYSSFSPFGFDGGFYYSRLNFSF